MTDPRRPAPDCDVPFAEALALSDAGVVALEDYSRVLLAAIRADALRSDADEARVIGVRLVAPPSPASAAERRDIEDFARALATESGGLGLGWA